MKRFLFLTACLVTISLSLFSSESRNNTIIKPHKATFDSSSVIHYYHGGGMAYESLNIYIRYDSCIRVDMNQGKDVRKSFVMTDDLRAEAQKLLNESDIYHIHTQNLDGIIYDKATTEVCFNQGKSKFCLSTGSSTSIKEADQPNFRLLCDGIIAFSQKK